MSTVVMQPGGPGGGALWRAEKACCRQAKRSGAVPKARLRKLVDYNSDGFRRYQKKVDYFCRFCLSATVGSPVRRIEIMKYFPF